MLTPEQQESKDAVLAGNRRAMARLITSWKVLCLKSTEKDANSLKRSFPIQAIQPGLRFQGCRELGKAPSSNPLVFI